MSSYIKQNVPTIQTADIIIDQIRNAKKTNTARYTESTKKFSANLKFLSPKAYNFTRKHLKLPSENIIKQMTGRAKFDEGLNMPSMLALTEKAQELSERERICSKFCGKVISTSSNFSFDFRHPH